MARKLSDKEVQDLAIEIVSSTPELKKLPTDELKEWLTRYKIEFDDEDIKALEEELIGFYGINTNEASKPVKDLPIRESFSQSIRGVIVNESNASMFGTPIKHPSDLEKGKTYTWCGGAELLDITYVGLSNKHPDKKPGSSMGKGFLFEWTGTGKYMELSMNAIRENVIEKEEEVVEGVEDGAYDELIRYAEKNKKFLPVVNLFAQVLNGGIQQYIDNGYLDRSHSQAMEILNSAGGLAKSLYNELHDLSDTMSEYASAMDDRNDDAAEEAAEELDEFDSKFYKEYDNNDFYNDILTAIKAEGGKKVDEGTGRKIKEFPFVMHWSDGVAQALGGDTYLDLINAANAKGLKSFAIFKQAPGFHSTSQEQYLVAWYDKDGNGYWSNRAKKEPDLNDRKLNDDFQTPSEIEEATTTEVVPTHICIVDLKDGIDTTPLIPKGAEVAISDDLVVEDIKNGIICDIDEQELEIHFKPIEQAEAANEAAENEYHMTVSKKLFAAIYNMKPGERTKLLEEILKVPAGPIKERTRMAAEALAKQPTEYKKALKVVHPKLYKSIYEEETPKRFPMIAECNEEGVMTVNPLYEAIKNPKFKLEKVRITNEFEEDDLPCINAVAYINNRRYKFSDWYLEHKTVKKYHLAEAGDRGAIQGIRNRLTRLGNEFIKEHKALQKELAAAKINEEALAAKNAAIESIKQHFNEIKGLDPVKDKRKIAKLEENISKLAKSNAIHVDEIAALNDNGGLPFKNEAVKIDKAYITKELKDFNTGISDFDAMFNNIVAHIRLKDEKALDDLKQHLGDSMNDRGDKINTNAHEVLQYAGLIGLNEAEDQEYFEIESKLRDVCFQHSQQQISNDDAVQQIQEILKDSEELSAVFTDVAPEALVDEVINYYGWTASDLAEAKEEGSEGASGTDEIDARFKQICADYYADLLPTADAIEQAKAALDDCKESHPELHEAVANCDDEDIMYAISSHFGWNAFDLAESVKK